MALILALLMMAVLLMMVVGMLSMGRGRLFSSAMARDSLSAKYVAEAGVADSMLALESNVAWAGVSQQQLGRGHYSVRFGSGPPDLQSVNNLLLDTPADSYRGTATVPPRSALLIVQAQVGSSLRTLEVLISKGTTGMSGGAALQSSGRILAQGDLKVDGIKSFSDATAVSAGLFSTLSGTGSDLIRWSGGTATISGTVSSVGSSAGAVNMPGASIAQGIQTGVAPRPFQAFDIPASVSAHSSAPAPTLNGTGVTVLSGGDFYYNGDLDLNGGSLKLDNAKLYVNGKLTINGSLNGTGSVFVNGDTSLQGDTSIASNANTNLALLSQGNVDIRGFDGSQFLQGLAGSDAQLATWMSQAGTTLQDLQTLMSTKPATDLVAGGPDYGTVDAMRRTLGQDSAASTHNGYPPNLFRKIHDKVALQPSTPQQQFVLQRLDKLDRFFDSKQSLSDLDLTAPVDIPARMADFQGGQGLFGGWFDSAIDGGAAYLADFSKMIVFTQQINFDRIGSAYFQGQVYTRGSFYASQEINVIGSVVAHGDPTGSSRVVGGETLAPGDVYLTGGSRITGVESVGGAPGPPGAGELRVVCWLGR
jgi:hypothetical protein